MTVRTSRSRQLWLPGCHGCRTQAGGLKPAGNLLQTFQSRNMLLETWAEHSNQSIKHILYIFKCFSNYIIVGVKVSQQTTPICPDTLILYKTHPKI